ncbi:MAG TPA: hypothetical protein DCY51_01745 [Bacteroidetes bacterium]|nr:hypothetical protein [Bacteroidota bacterium]
MYLEGNYKSWSKEEPVGKDKTKSTKVVELPYPDNDGYAYVVTESTYKNDGYIGQEGSSSKCYVSLINPLVPAMGTIDVIKAVMKEYK